ncbi:Maf family nucleotide pyrophosphatase [Membranihabitans maritimus]|uniref:Maf family nucleotide pyrophosphatase n=1 Tax=Membranihabitans maritimus TaxID=2904244 RepID=UPI001F018542|nr:Maf family nucleotide pyrophosphatase [Membranihabitans maritimus]
MQYTMPTIFLASGSPRRLELLKNLDLNVRQKKLPFTEKINRRLSSNKIAEEISYYKAKQAITHIKNDEILLTADTIVCKGNEILVKPRNQNEAFEFLTKLSDTSHSVITGVTMGIPNKLSTFSAETKVYFEPLSKQEIHYYVEKYKPLDKAGAYGIQEWIGWSKIFKIEGSFSNVMGLPTHMIHNYLVNWQKS